MYENDIPRNIALAAHYGTSFVPDKRADQERAGYAEDLRSDYAELAKLADTDDKRAILADEFERYRAAKRARTIKYLASRSGLMSSMITGPSNFPVERMRKRGDTVHRRLTDLLEFRERALAAIRKKLCPELRPIMAGDHDAIARLTAEIEEAERLQDVMKTANATIRKHAGAGAEAQVAALVAIGFAEERAKRLLVPDFCRRIGFPDYELTNNNANIRRMKGRLVQITAAKAKPDSTVKGANATVEDSPADNRVRLFFPGKPAESVRSELKAAGFRWTPSLGCWQAYRNSRSVPLAAKVAGIAY
jgi:hypothetical protein